jgi:hypothetical protein
VLQNKLQNRELKRKSQRKENVMAKVTEYTSKFYVGPINNPQDVFESTGKPTGQGFGAARKGPQVTGKEVNLKDKSSD